MGYCASVLLLKSGGSTPAPIFPLTKPGTNEPQIRNVPRIARPKGIDDVTRTAIRLRNIARSDPKAALAAFEALDPPEEAFGDRHFRSGLLRALLDGWASTAPQDARHWIEQNVAPPFDLPLSLVEFLGRSDPEAALDLIRRYSRPVEGQQLLVPLFVNWLEFDRDAALHTATDPLVHGPNRSLLGGIAEQLAVTDPGAALKFARQLPLATMGSESLDGVLRIVDLISPSTAIELQLTALTEHLESEAVLDQIAAVADPEYSPEGTTGPGPDIAGLVARLKRLESSDPDAALRIASRISSARLRNAVASHLKISGHAD